MNKPKIKQLFPNCYIIIYEKQYDLAMSFIRLQEFYESPKFRGKYFTLEEYMDWYAIKTGHFTYLEDFPAFNVPGDILLKWYEKFYYDCFRKKEQILIDSILKIKCGNWKKVYFIGVSTEYKDYTQAVDHEIAHAMYYLNIKYRKECKKLIKENDVTYIQCWVKQKGYNKSVIDDEVQAYLSTNNQLYNIVKDKKYYETLAKKFKKNYNKFKPCLK